jgi:glucokinase
VSVHLGLDIGGTKTEAVVTDEHGTVLTAHRVDSGRGPAAVVGAALLAANHACAAADTSPGFVDSAGVGIPGAITNGEVRHAVNLGIDRLDLAATLAGHWGKRPVVDNDVNAAAIGAWVLAGDGSRSMAYLNAGTGLAAGLVFDGRLWRGARGAAGEIGHVSVNPAGPTGPDGLPGGLEAYAGGVGIALAAGDGRTAAEILADPAAHEARAGLYFGVASAIRVLVLTLDVEEVVVGGGVTRLGPELEAGVRAHLLDWAANSTFLASIELTSRFRVLDTDEPIAAIGAAMLGAGRG